MNYAKFDQYGKVNNAWLNFTSKGKLYRIEVEYADNGDVFKLLKDALDTKYGTGKYGKSFGFNKNYHYKDKKTAIYLIRNEFGFGTNQRTSLIYEWTPSLNGVRITKNKIEKDIKLKNAKKAMGDL